MCPVCSSFQGRGLVWAQGRLRVAGEERVGEPPLAIPDDFPRRTPMVPVQVSETREPRGDWHAIPLPLLSNALNFVANKFLIREAPGTSPSHGSLVNGTPAWPARAACSFLCRFPRPGTGGRPACQLPLPVAAVSPRINAGAHSSSDN